MVEKISLRAGLELGTARSVGQKIFANSKYLRF